jgi:DNA modification methylase
MTRQSPISKSMIAETHPPYYLIHRYWARKPSNVVRAYIEHFTKQGEIVLDPFVGSGVSVIESVRTGRKAIGVDINPTAITLTNGTAIAVSRTLLEEYVSKIESKVKTLSEDLFRTRCNSCGKASGVVTHVVWSTRYRCPNDNCSALVSSSELVKRGSHYACPSCAKSISITRAGIDEIPLELWYSCTNCMNKEKREPDSEDKRLLESIDAMSIKTPASEFRMLRNPRLLIFGDTRVSDFFTKRNLIILSSIVKEIELIEDPAIRDVLRNVLTGGVAQASKLVAYRNGFTTGGPAWTVSGFWIPSKHFEINAWTCFKNRYAKMLKGKLSLSETYDEIIGLREYHLGKQFEDLNLDKNVLLINKSMTKITRRDIHDESVDYIFADPPYGDSVPYLEYSQIMYSWFGLKPDFENEIIISNSSEREKGISDYKHLLTEAFAQCHRVLKKNKWLTITFHNRDIHVWEALMSSVIAAGFVYVNCTYQIPAVVPAKAQLVKNSSMKGDMIINFIKSSQKAESTVLSPSKVKAVVVQAAKNVVAFHGGQASDDQVWRGIILSLLEHGDSRILQKEVLDYLMEGLVKQGDSWILKEQDRELLNKVKTLDEVVTSITLDELRKGNKSEQLIMSRVYNEAKEPFLPDIDDVLRTVKRLKNEAELSRQRGLFSN